ncbi:MAG: hypothetical protein JRG94_10960, partial [Deltaproteobacteria bacterium]|nr:hypothetical protein [Deltaproteobacteria bacterium]
MAPQRPTPTAELTTARETIERGLDALRFDPEPLVIDRLTSLAGLLSNWAPRMNLTGHRGADEI